jgi:hypothetical protein
MKSKMNIGLAISRNFSKVTLEILDEDVEYQTPDELRSKVQKIFDVLRDEVEVEFEKIQGK